MSVVAVLAVDGVLGFELTVPVLVFGTAAMVAGEDVYEVRVCAERGSTVDTAAGHLSLRAPWDLDAAAEEADTLVVPARSGFRDDPPPAVLHTITRAAERGARLASICTGAFDLARTGLLDGRRATTHWRYASELARRHPAVDVDPSVLFVDEGDVLTSAGVAAGLDLCLHMLRRDHGAALAAEVARTIVVPPQREGGQAQFVRHEDPADPGASLQPTLMWLETHLREPLTLGDIARHAGTSVRSLSRRFREQTGTTPLRWLLRARVRRAQQLLETTDLPVDRVAEEAGFGAPATLRHHFTRLVGTSPRTYRRSFRPTLR
ncbi:transcriptional regulator, AraC family with amidase-like domain [Streptoalloteichus tenebrarius]|uniref:Transcriptional regulator, AraC family with amidase-like domain n=1 Tax=Streptoalloteichus tenebrarius (strain ATCC 17920 / DSM 40477 / JCM 4838 / CBS 697.72 / NBRC 16177 / NCIMB 11028 / NRRL B-12390 / A12253. 1 / ISP 5477) TaxID=1933 RepID=A0ABT1I3P9_STRSD|nr:helix-turn-helix domain-containing protein [Streptoalloteichus tenebrarius]MCP2262423.1 transcriptional regulator, AraC family with amidase-like domain [Streptoalloteichus tenebrarius]